ncbi:hypothetical protein [Paenarthrobacter sp. YJN-5]|uniref:hypothetical protein n=1 Tax=Paenarthrobacter sp. YJN-5 TaxID=2735316 RepID=UPI001878D596|nr:hypothetical protein [Paenarthrobacter sp. YJN-5]QOT18073.1 hypothetical protein HMI59_16665 [Paenarthrobacter sp. YJN-5]
MAKKTAPVSNAAHPVEVQYEYHVSYFDSEVGRVQVEEFEDLQAAERFASIQLRSEDCWAVVERFDIQAYIHLAA